MEISSFQSYLIILFVVLIIISIFVFRQFLKTRNEELSLVKFEQTGLDSLTNATELYEFGSIQIKKRLYPEAIKTFLKAIENYENEPDEAKAIINNALGFSYAAQNEFKKEGIKVFGLLLSNFVIGICVFHVVLDEAQINFFAVNHKYRKKGFGTYLMSYLINECKKLNVNKLFLEVSHTNSAAEKFYSRFEFSTVGIRRNYYKDGSDALLKEKKLTTK